MGAAGTKKKPEIKKEKGVVDPNETIIKKNLPYQTEAGNFYVSNFELLKIN